MAWFDDIDILNDASDPITDFGTLTNGFDSPTLNDSAATTPIYVEGSACGWMPLKKGVTNGYNATATISGTPTLTNRIVVGFLNYPFADIDLIPITALYLRLSSSTGFTTNYLQWDALSQISSPENIPISGHTPIIGYEDAGTETGTFNGNCESIGWVATTGGGADGKQGGFDWFFVISYVGAHSATLSGTFFSGLQSEYYDNGNSLPGETSRPIAVLSGGGSSFKTNIRFQLGHGTSDTANLVVTETGKTITFNNLHVNHELGYVFVDPASTHEIRLTLTDCVHVWNDQASGNEIFDGITNVSYFKIDGCAFSNGGKISLPADTANRWVRNTKFANCQAGTASDGEFTDCILDSCYTMVISGDADFTGTQVLNSAVAADASALEWNGAFDPDGNLDSMSFSKGTNAHHAIGFGTASPTTMTLRGIDFSGFNATNAQNDSTLYFARTSGTVTVNLVGCTGDISYKSAGATIVLVSDPVTVSVNIKDLSTGLNIQNVRVLVYVTSGANFPYQDSITITGSGTTGTVTHTAHGLATNDYIIIEGAVPDYYNGVYQITVTGVNTYTFTDPETLSTSPATGTITATFAFISGLTDVSGNISDSRVVAAAQPITGWARKSSASPFYKQGAIGGTVSSTTGLATNLQLASDE